MNLKFEYTYAREEDILIGAIAKKGLHGHRGLILRVRVEIPLDPLCCGDGAKLILRDVSVPDSRLVVEECRGEGKPLNGSAAFITVLSILLQHGDDEGRDKAPVFLIKAVVAVIYS